MYVMRSARHELLAQSEQSARIIILCIFRKLDERDKQVPPDVSDVGLDVPFLMSGIRIAETALEPILHAEPAEHLILFQHSADPASDSCRIFEHYHSGDAFYMLEYIDESLADALAVFSRGYLAVRFVRVRKR